MGVSQHIGKKFQDRVVWNTNKKVKGSFGQFGASKATYMSWFGTAKAFANVQNGRTYTQVASQTPKCTCGTFTNRDNVKGTRIVTVPQRNANAALVTSSKVSIEPKSSRPVGRSSPVALKYRVCAKNVIQPSKASFDIPVKNTFQILQHLMDNTGESHENAPTGLDEVVTASAGTTLQRSYKEIPNGFHKQVYDHKLEVLASPSNSHNNIGYTLEKDTNSSQLATLGDGGTGFKPAPESGQAYDLSFSDSNALPYVREEKIPLYIWNHRNTSKDHKACLMQNNGIFGYVPLTDLKIYTGPPVTWDVIPDIIQAHNLVQESGVPNFLKCRIPVETNLNANIWRTYPRLLGSATPRFVTIWFSVRFS